MKELTTKVVAAHVLLEKTPEDTIYIYRELFLRSFGELWSALYVAQYGQEIGDDRVQKVSDLRDDIESLRKAAVQHLGASRSKCNKLKAIL